MSIFQTVKELFAKFGLDRVMGYFRPLSGYNKGKVAEYNERKFFSEEKVRQNIGKIKKTKTQVIEK